MLPLRVDDDLHLLEQRGAHRTDTQQMLDPLHVALFLIARRHLPTNLRTTIINKKISYMLSAKKNDLLQAGSQLEIAC